MQLLRKISLATEAFVWLLIAAAALRILPFNRLIKQLSLFELPAGVAFLTSVNTASQSVRLRQVGGYLEKLARWLRFQKPCLSVALAGWAMLRIRGIKSVIVLGARRDSDRLSAHAWLLDASDHAITGRHAGVGFKPISLIQSR